MSECTLLGWLTVGVLTATLTVVAWYTVETSGLRREAQRQAERSGEFVEIPSDERFPDRLLAERGAQLRLT